MKIKNYYKEVSIIKIWLINFIGGLLTGFPILIGVIFLLGSNKILGLSILSVSIFIVILLNSFLNKFTKVRNKNNNEYITMVLSFITLGISIMLSTNFILMFIKFS